MSKEINYATGRILMVQESRFRLGTEDGPTLLFSLSAGASTSEMDLIDLQQANTRVVVAYEGEPNLDTGIVHSIRPVK